MFSDARRIRIYRELELICKCGRHKIKSFEEAYEHIKEGCPLKKKHI